MAEQCLDSGDAAPKVTVLNFIDHFLLNVDSVNDTVCGTLGNTIFAIERDHQRDNDD